MNDDASRQRMDTATRQQPRMQQYDSQYQDTYSSYQPQQPQYDNRESPVNARRQQQHQIQYQQQQQHQRQEHDRRYDTAHRDDYAKGQVDMREVSRYPPVQQQQYGHPAAHGYYGGGDNDGRLQPQNARTSSGPAYAPAPVATASMADLRDSLTASTTTSDGKPAKKPKRVYETAFGHFSWSDLLKRKYWKYYAILLVIGILVLLAVIFHDDIITWMQPVAEKIRDIPGGWAIWVGIMFVISFPPLFGQEVICLLCGLIYGLWWGFAIISLGTMLGEWGNFLVFKYWCAARSAKTEEKDVTYACMCRVVREGGFKIAFMARLSAIPGHLTTPVFAACGMGFWVFSITAFLTLPKQLMAVYLGTVFGKPDTGEGITTSKIVEWIVLGISFIITIIAAWYIYAKMAKWRPIVLEEQAANRLNAQEILERDPVSTNDGDLEQLKHDIPRVTLSDETGVVKSPSSRSQRFSLNRWPIHGQGRQEDLDRRTGQRDLRRMEEGSFGDLDGANSPLVADSAAPAGHPYDQQGLYPLSYGNSPYHSSEEGIGYGYADGGETYNSPRNANHTYDAGTSTNVSMKWQPPRLAEDPLPGPRPQKDRPLRQPDHAAEQHGHQQPARYDPNQYRQQYRSPTHSTAAVTSQHDDQTQQSSSLPNSYHPSQDIQAGQYPANPAFSDERSASTPMYTPRSAPASGPASASYPNSQRASFDANMPQGARLYPSNQNLMPQPGNALEQETYSHNPPQAAPSRYPDMIEPREGHPIGNTQYRSGPTSHPSNRYHSEPDPSRPSPYHTGQIDPGAAYRNIQ